MTPDPDDPRTRLLLELAERIGHDFARPDLLAEALVHPSMGNERPESYERLEFLGDAVLGFLVSGHLFHRWPDVPEGDLTRMRSAIVSKEPLAAAARTLDLLRYVQVGRGLSSAELQSERILANLFESVLAAIYIDGGVRPARRFVRTHLLAERDDPPPRETPRDPKTMLLHLAQGAGLGQPTYRVEGESGPDHQRVFAIVVELNGEALGRGEGRSKREGERAAATAAMSAVRELIARGDAETAGA